MYHMTTLLYCRFIYYLVLVDNTSRDVCLRHTLSPHLHGIQQHIIRSVYDTIYIYFRCPVRLPKRQRPRERGGAAVAAGMALTKNHLVAAVAAAAALSLTATAVVVQAAPEARRVGKKGQATATGLAT